MTAAHCGDASQHARAKVSAHGDPSSDMVWIAPGVFDMGSASHYPEERPVRRAAVAGFWIDRTPVTTRAFAAFVASTGHV